MFLSKRSISIYFWLYLYAFAFLLISTGEACAQLQADPPAEEQKEPEPQWPEDSLGRRNPRGTVYGFIKAVSEQNYKTAARFLNLDPAIQRNDEGTELVADLQRVLDQGGNIMPYSWISKDPHGYTNDDLPPNVDRIGTVTVKGETIRLFVEAIEDPEGGPIWLFSSETVEEVAAVDWEDTIFLVDRFLPDFLKDNLWGGVPVGHWLIIPFLAVLAYGIAWCITLLILFLISLFRTFAHNEPVAGIIKALALPVRLFIAILLFVKLSQEVGISIIVRQQLSGTTLIIGLFALLLFLWQLANFLSHISEERMSQRGHQAGISLIFFLRRVFKIAIAFFGGIAILGTLGIDITTGLAALGIGGIALALGAQKAMENFVGSVTLIVDRPIRVGDFCKAGDTLGTVEQIGMRSTRIRTLDRTLVVIPNGEFSSTKIENYAHRDRFRFNPIFGLRYETTADQMRYLLVELRSILYAHPKVDPDPARVRFVEFGSASLNIEVFSYINASDFNDFLEVREDLLLRMMDVVDASGTGFAFPSQTLYLARDQGLSKEKTKNAEQKVRSWRETGEMQIPGFDPQSIQNLKDTIPYPPEGSTRRRDEPEV